MSKLFGSNIIPTQLYIPKGVSSWSLKDFLEKDKYKNLLLISFGLQDGEIVDIKRCFNEITHIFSYGRNAAQSVLEISFLVFLNDGCGGKKDKGEWLTLKKAQELYEKNRIYKKLQPIPITIDDFSTAGFLIHMSISQVDPVIKAAVLTFQFILDMEV